MPGPLLVLDENERVALASPSAHELFGHPCEDLVGRDLHELFPDGIEQTPAAGLTRCGATRRIEVARRRMEIGGEAFALLWLDDVTERRDVEESLKRTLRHLERATQAKSDLVASMSHEIRTPMNAVLGMTDILLESELSDEQREIAERVRRAGVSLLSTLNDALDLSKVEAGRLDLEPRSFCLRTWLREVLELFHLEAAAKGLELRSRVSDDVPEKVCGDAPRLRQVLVNLIGNAVKFTVSGRIEVEVGLHTEEDLRFAVRDTGSGIAAEELGRLFEPWTQAGPATERASGTGLGLAISRRLVERMGGTIEASSEPGVGSEFRFSIPSMPRAHSKPARLDAHRDADTPTRRSA